MRYGKPLLQTCSVLRSFWSLPGASDEAALSKGVVREKGSVDRGEGMRIVLHAVMISTLSALFMARLHGAKKYYQLLLDPHRAELLETQAAAAGMRTSAFVRELVYAAVKRSTDGSAYALAEAQDQALRRRGIQNQVLGRTRP